MSKVSSRRISSLSVHRAFETTTVKRVATSHPIGFKTISAGRKSYGSSKPTPRIVWPSGHGDEVGVFTGTLADAVHLLRRSRRDYNIVQEHGARAVLIDTRWGPVTLVSEPEGPSGLLAIVADAKANTVGLLGSLKRLLGAHNVSGYTHATTI